MIGLLPCFIVSFFVDRGMNEILSVFLLIGLIYTLFFFVQKKQHYQITNYKN